MDESLIQIIDRLVIDPYHAVFRFESNAYSDSGTDSVELCIGCLRSYLFPKIG